MASRRFQQEHLARRLGVHCSGVGLSGLSATFPTFPTFLISVVGEVEIRHGTPDWGQGAVIPVDVDHVRARDSDA